VAALLMVGLLAAGAVLLVSGGGLHVAAWVSRRRR
jgi:hypothetical protein